MNMAATTPIIPFRIPVSCWFCRSSVYEPDRGMLDTLGLPVGNLGHGRSRDLARPLLHSRILDGCGPLVRPVDGAAVAIRRGLRGLGSELPSDCPNQTSRCPGDGS